VADEQNLSYDSSNVNSQEEEKYPDEFSEMDSDNRSQPQEE